MCCAGVVGAWTLPQLAVAFGATALAVALDRRVRLATIIGLVSSVAAIYAWYAPHAGAVHSASQIPDGVQIDVPWVVTAPIDQILLPALIWIDGTALVAGLVWLPLVVLAAAVVAASPLIRERASALVLSAGAIATILVLWITDAYVIPRYMSFLLAPIFMLVATGAARILGGIAERGGALRAVACLVLFAVLAVRFAVVAPDVVGLPREANRDVAEVIAQRTSTPVIAYMRHPENLSFYLNRPVHTAEPAALAATVCKRKSAVFYVFQPFALDDVPVPCLDRTGVEHHRFRQYARGNEMDVWFVPPGG
jgi:hypothetical protein